MRLKRVFWPTSTVALILSLVPGPVRAIESRCIDGRACSLTFVFASVLSLGLPARAPTQKNQEGRHASTTLSGYVIDASGAPVADVKVTATNVESKTALTTTTNRRGEYFFGTLALGRYQVTARVKGFTAMAKIVSLRPASSSILNFIVPMGPNFLGEIDGVIRDQSRKSVPSTLVLIEMEGGGYAANPKVVGGSYSQAGLPPGTYLVIVKAPGFKTVKRRVTLGPRARKKIDFRLRR